MKLMLAMIALLASTALLVPTVGGEIASLPVVELSA